jgi:hypothetical protein
MSFEMTVLSDAKLLWDYHRFGRGGDDR